MNIQVNGQQQQFPNESNLKVTDLLAGFELKEQRGIAVAINDRIIPKSQWPQTQLADGDIIEIIRATQGG